MLDAALALGAMASLAGLASLAFGDAVLAQGVAARSGDHPAVVVQRLHAQQGYDYAARFYPHPAWMYLLPEAPRPMMEHPAIVVARRDRQRRDAPEQPAAPSADTIRLATQSPVQK